MAGTRLLGAGNMKDCLRHFKCKFQIRSNQDGQTSEAVKGIYEIIHMLLNYDSLDCNEEKAPETSEERADLGC